MTALSPQQRCRIERIQMLARQMRMGRRIAAVATGLLGLMIVPAVGWLAYSTWALCMIVSFAVRERVVKQALERGAKSERDETFVAASSVALGVVIGMPGLLFLPHMDPDMRGIYTAVHSAWVANAVLIIGIHVRTYTAYAFVTYLLLALGWWRFAPLHVAATMSALLALALLVLNRFSSRLALLFNESVLIRHENAELVVKLTGALDEAAAAGRARAQFLAAASHDLLQPVHALIVLVGVLRESDSPSLKDRAARRIELTTNTIAAMFRGLLDLARLDAGAIKPVLAPVMLGTVCRSIEAAYVAPCEEKGLSLQVDCPPDVRALADAALLDRVLRNLVDNAVKFTESGSVALVVEARTDDIRVSVIDTGVGIEPADQPRVFDAFFRGAGASRLAEGVGLGLSVTAQMLDLMGGKIELGSAAGGGTRVDVVLPPAPAATRRPKPEPAPRALRFHRILLVEDDLNAREALTMWLAHRGCHVVAAASLDEALAACGELAGVPDYILSDLHLADGPDGIETIATLRARLGAVPAALITGEAIDSGDVPPDIALLRKPVQLPHLERLLQSTPAEHAA